MMTSRRYTKTAFVLGLVGLAAACGDDTDTPTDEDYEDIAQSVAPLIRNDLAVQGGLMLSAQVAVGAAPGWLSIDASGEAHGQAGALSWSVLASCTDASGNAEVACSETSGAAKVTSSLEGKLMLPSYSAALTANLDWSVAGLQTDTITGKGQSNVHAETHFSGLFRPVTRSFELDFAANYDVSVPRDLPSHAAGTLTASIDAHRLVSGTNHDSEAHFQVDASVTLDGTGNAILTLDGNATFRLDLASGRLIHVEGTVGG